MLNTLCKILSKAKKSVESLTALGDSRRKRRHHRVIRVESLEERSLLSALPVIQDSASVGWHSYHDLTESQWIAVFNELRGSSIPVDIEISDNGGGSARIGAVWNTNTDGRGWYLWRNLSSTSFGEKWTQYNSQNYRLVDQEVYQLGATTYYAGIWIQNKESLGWASRRNMTGTSYQAFVNDYQASYLPVDVDVTNINGTATYSAIFEQNTKNVGWIARHGLNSSEYSALFDQLRGSYRVSDFESYTVNGQQRYAVVWVKNTNGRGWASYRDMTEVGYWNRWNQLNDQGYRLLDFERYQTPSGWRYAGVWRQDGSRLNWRLRSNVDTLALKQLNDFNVPGLSVSVVQNGRFLYRRGFGYQDKASGLQYSAMTVNRLASVSKAVGGVLSMDLVERGLLDINRTTRSYVSSMPTHHTHTLRQLLSNRSGAGHYRQWGNVSGSFGTALAASAKFWSRSLQSKPGTKYLYSTHGYTLLGAAIEGAMGKSIQRTVQDELTSRYGLGTLRVENRLLADRYRSRVYNDLNQSVTPDDLSWKVLGGGLESSGVDLAKFGARLLSGGILNSTSLNTMWTAPDSLKNYGLGWSLGTTSGGVKWVAKDGSQLGANTYLLIFPDKGIVISVLSNRQNGGHSASALANSIGALLVR